MRSCWSLVASQRLGHYRYVVAVQEDGVPVTYGYISDAHGKHPSGPAYGPSHFHP